MFDVLDMYSKIKNVILQQCTSIVWPSSYELEMLSLWTMVLLKRLTLLKRKNQIIGKMDRELKNCFLFKSRGEGHLKLKINVFIQN